MAHLPRKKDEEETDSHLLPLELKELKLERQMKLIEILEKHKYRPHKLRNLRVIIKEEEF